MRRLLCLLFLLLPLLPVFGFDVKAGDEAAEAIPAVRKAVEQALSPLLPETNDLSVFVDSFTKRDSLVSCAITVTLSGTSIQETAVVPEGKWRRELPSVLVKQLRSDALLLNPPSADITLTSRFRFSYATEKGERAWRTGSVWGAYNALGKLSGIMVVSDVRKDVVVLQALSDASIRIGSTLKPLSSWSADLFVGYNLTARSVVASADAYYSWPSPLELTMGMLLLKNNPIVEAGLSVTWPFSLIGDHGFFRNSSLSAAARFGIGFSPLVFGSSATVQYRYAFTPAWSFAAAWRIGYYARIKENTAWYYGHMVMLGVSYRW